MVGPELWGSSGQLINIDNGDEERATACALTSEGKLLLVRGWVRYGTDYQGVILIERNMDRWTRAFPAMDGVSSNSLRVHQSFITDVHVTNTGDIYICGDVLDQGRKFALAKFNSSGVLQTQGSVTVVSLSVTLLGLLSLLGAPLSRGNRMRSWLWLGRPRDQFKRDIHYSLQCQRYRGQYFWN